MQHVGIVDFDHRNPTSIVCFGSAVSPVCRGAVRTMVTKVVTEMVMKRTDGDHLESLPIDLPEGHVDIKHFPKLDELVWRPPTR